MEIVRRSLDEIVPPAWNVRTNHNVKGIANSIRIHGMRDPIGVWTTCEGEALDEPYLIVEGSGRWYALQTMDYDRTVDTIPHDFDSTASARAYALQHNHQGDLSENDDGMLLDTLEELHASDRLDDTGFTTDDMEELQARLARAGGKELHGDPDATVDVPDDPITQRGDVWICEEHRVMCGDATSEEDVTTLLAGHEPGLMVTDPPYGLNYDAHWRVRYAEGGLLSHGPRRVGKVTNDDRVDWSEAWGHAPCDVAYIWYSPRHSGPAQASAESAGYEMRAYLVWAKPKFAISRGHYHGQHEVCLYLVRKGATAQWDGDRKQTTLWEISLDANVEGGHSTQKPVECMARPMRNHAHTEVYDPFLGSGTTLIAAEMTGRTCYAMEIEPGYVDVSVRRWINATGGEARRASDGETFRTGDAV